MVSFLEASSVHDLFHTLTLEAVFERQPLHRARRKTVGPPCVFELQHFPREFVITRRPIPNDPRRAATRGDAGMATFELASESALTVPLFGQWRRH